MAAAPDFGDFAYFSIGGNTAWSPVKPTKLHKIKNLHSTDTIDTENSGTRGRPLWVDSSQVGKSDSKWVCHVVPAYPNVSPGPMNGSILLRWAYTYRIANFSLGGPHLRNRLGQATGRQSKPTSGPPIDDTLYANSCPSCNRIKGDRPQEYLVARLAEIGV